MFFVGNFLVIQDLVLSLLWVQVQSLVWELRSHKPCGVTLKKKCSLCEHVISLTLIISE